MDAFNDLGLALGANQTFTTPDVPRAITGCCLTAAGQFQFQFTGVASANYTVLCSTNPALPLGIGRLSALSPILPTARTNSPTQAP